MNRTWSLQELAEESQRYLSDDGDSRRVQWKPNGRQIRYYSTLGLLDKPDTENGRTVWYGPRHLLQLLTIKHLQGEGMTLSQIQRATAGKTPEQLRRLLNLPDDFLGELHNSVTKPPSPRREAAFWAARPTASPPHPSGPRFRHSWQAELSPGVTLTLDDHQASALTDEERDELAREFAQTWRKLHEKRMKDQP